MLSADGKLSSKRVITFIAFILVSIAFGLDLAFSIKMDALVLNGMIQIVFAGLGVTVGEHLLKKRPGGNYDGNYDSNYDSNYNDEPNYYDSKRINRPKFDDDDDERLGDN